MNRRAFLSNITVGALAASAGSNAFPVRGPKQGITFSFGTYGMKSLGPERSFRTIADIGFDGVELAARPEWDSTPEQLNAERRNALKAILRDNSLTLTAIMAELRPVEDEPGHAEYLQRLQRITALGQDLTSGEAPVVQTILGGGVWEQKKNLLVRRIADWVRVAERAKMILCIKPHRGGVMSTPSQAAWIIRQLGEPHWLRMVYDYSHYAFRNLTIANTVKTALPYTAHIAIKDTIRKGDGTTFVLPGDGGTVDYEELFRLFYLGGYRRDICCEVSSAVWSKSGYDPVAAAQRCYQNIAPVFEKTKIPRRHG